MVQGLGQGVMPDRFAKVEAVGWVGRLHERSPYPLIQTLAVV